MEIRNDGETIGYYERSQPQDIERKEREIRKAARMLIDIYRQHESLPLDGMERGRRRLSGTTMVLSVVSYHAVVGSGRAGSDELSVSHKIDLPGPAAWAVHNDVADEGDGGLP